MVLLVVQWEVLARQQMVDDAQGVNNMKDELLGVGEGHVVCHVAQLGGGKDVVDAGKVVPEVAQHVVAQQADDQPWNPALK